MQESLEKKVKRIEILKIESLSREPLIIEGFLFKGKSKKAPKIAIVGAMEGEGILPLYCASKLVDFFKNKIDAKRIKGDVLIIPSVNHYAFNSGKRFWPLDNTDINMMFPGYGLGETTQRIAKKVFDVLNGYTFGVILEKRQDPVNCIPYIKLLESEFEDLEGAKKFGFKFIHHKNMKSIDSVTLQYNWQLWGTKAYSIVCPTLSHIDNKISSQINQAILRFMNKNEIIDFSIFNAYDSTVIKTEEIRVIKSLKSGIFIPKEFPGSYVVKEQIMGEIIDSLEGNVIYEFKSPCDGMITCNYNSSLIYENAVAFRVAKVG
ncbi:peptidase M14 family metallocarboxypeptidase, succinylglutamate desuccinylase/aspartoacylase-like protein [Halarcobacter ebronensis]|nr:peptidase M14 family metallocarboxypeptidase, succinylglutamate desuccinylase/aspartoacylase-like protein [Halarcobacter ebronensis]